MFGPKFSIFQIVPALITHSLHRREQILEPYRLCHGLSWYRKRFQNLPHGRSLNDNGATENPLKPSMKLCRCHCCPWLCLQFSVFWLYWSSSCNAWASLVAARRRSCSMGFRGGEESTCQCRRRRFDPLIREDPLEEDTAIHTSILAWRISWTEEPGWLQSTGSQRVSRD